MELGYGGNGKESGSNPFLVLRGWDFMMRAFKRLDHPDEESQISNKLTALIHKDHVGVCM